jgi:putative solute:sodium symporter small subunit
MADLPLNPAPAEPPQISIAWQRTRRLSLQLLLAWFLITFPTVFFARELSSLTLFGWPLPFYLVAQGAVLGYVAIVGLYAWRMQREEQRQTGNQGQQS